VNCETVVSFEICPFVLTPDGLLLPLPPSCLFQICTAYLAYKQQLASLDHEECYTFLCCVTLDLNLRLPKDKGLGILYSAGL